MNQDKRFVYVLRSDRNPRRHYVGLTSDVQTRLDWHNAGQNEHTIHDRPWHVLVSLEFRTAEAAGQFERYLKTGGCRPGLCEAALSVASETQQASGGCPPSDRSTPLLLIAVRGP